MFRTRALQFAAGLAIAAGATPAVAQSGDTPTVLELTLEQARSTALANDLGLSIEGVASQASHFDFEGSWGSFDPVWSAAVGFTDSSRKPTSVVSIFNAFDEQTIDAETLLAYPLHSGGRFEFSAQHARTDSNPAFLPINPNVRDTVALSFRHPLLRGAGSKYATSLQRESELTALRQDERVRQVRQQLLLDVESAYWDLVAALDQLDVADQTLDLGRRQLDQNQRRLDAGVGTEVEVLQADANVARRIEQRLAREVAAKDAADKLKGLLYPGTDAGSWSLEIVPVTEVPPVDVGEVPEWQAATLVALEQRTELRQQVLAIDIAEQALVRSRSERKAALDFVASGTGVGFDSSEGASISEAAGFEFPIYNARLEFSLPIGNTSATNAEHAARARLRSARLVYDQLESQIVGEVRGAVRQIVYAAENVTAAQSSLALARRQLAAEEARFREGLSTNFQVLEFQQQLTEALYNETLARTGFAKARATLAHALGVLGETRP